MITYICGTNGLRYREFPKAFWEDVNSLMAEGDEILLGDSDFDHRVYGRCRNKQYENVSMMRYFPPRHSFPLSQIKADIPSRVKMVKKCDRMIAVWDGESEDVFLNLLLLTALNKKCKLYHLPSGSCIGIGTIEDIKPFVAECHGWTDEDIRDVFVKCGFSEEMVAYNTGDGKYGERYFAEIICKAPISLKAKYDTLQDLRKKNSIKYDAFINVSELMSKGAPFDRIEQTVCDVIGDYGVCLDDCCAAIRNKELVVITNYAENYANMENRKIKHFLNDYLLLRENFKNLFVLNDTNLDVRVFLSKVDDGIYPEYGLYPEDVRNFDVRKKIADVFRDKFKDYSDDENDICIEYESRSEEIQAAYFVTRYHSNKAWTWDPINVFNVRISAFVLPGIINPSRTKKMSANKKAKNYDSGTEYAIDSIHMNTDITYDLDEFKELVDGLFYNVTLA